MTGSVFTKPYTSAHNIVSLLYAVVFLLPFTHLFYVPLVIAQERLFCSALSCR